MRRWAFGVVLMGIFVLLIFFNKEGIEILGNGDLQDLELNSKVFLEGVVENERAYGDFRILEVNGISLICECSESYLEENVLIEGVVSEYEGEKQISVLSISKF